MRVWVDPERCQGHTLCSWSAPTLFRLQDEDGHAVAVDRDLTDDELEPARRAVEGCPEQAIQLLA
jgi:ferredoxin